MKLILQITAMKSPTLCLDYFYHETNSFLLMGGQNGKINLLKLHNLQYDGLWGSLQLPHSIDSKVTWEVLVQRGKGLQIKGVMGSDWIFQAKYYANLNAVRKLTVLRKVCSLKNEFFL